MQRSTNTIVIFYGTTTIPTKSVVIDEKSKRMWKIREMQWLLIVQSTYRRLDAAANCEFVATRSSDDILITRIQKLTQEIQWSIESTSSKSVTKTCLERVSFEAETWLWPQGMGSGFDLRNSLRWCSVESRQTSDFKRVLNRWKHLITMHFGNF